MSTSAGAQSRGEHELDEVGVTLCIYGETLVPSEVTAALGCEPTRSHVKGEVPGPRSPPRPTGAWFLEVRSFEPIDLDAMFQELFARLPQEQAVWQSLAAQFKLRIHLDAHTKDGCDLLLSPRTMQLIAARHAEVFLDFYAYGGNDAS